MLTLVDDLDGGGQFVGINPMITRCEWCFMYFPRPPNLPPPAPVTLVAQGWVLPLVQTRLRRATCA